MSSVKKQTERKTENFFDNLQCSKAGVADIRQVRLDLKWIGVGFLDLAIFLRVVWNAGATADIKAHAGNILSSYGNPCKLNPVQVYATCMCLPKCKGKGTWALPKNLRRLLTTIWQRKAVWKTLFQNKSSGTINPVHLPQTTPEQNKEGVNKNTLSISNLAQYFILQLWRNIPLTTMTSIELRLLNTCCITQKVRC